MFGILIGLIAISAVFNSDTSRFAAYGLKMAVVPTERNSNTMYDPTLPYFLQISIDDVIGMQNGIASEDVDRMLRYAIKAPLNVNNLKGIILNINSPGGTVTDSDSIYRALKAFRQKQNVPVFAYVNGICASGAYYIACAAEQIFTSPISIIGSVGVLTGPFFNVEGLASKYGVKAVTLSMGKDKEAFPFLEKLPDNYENLPSLNGWKTCMGAMYAIFVDIVVAARTAQGITKEKLTGEYGAQIFPPDLAHKYGYIDNGNATYFDCVSALVKKSDLADDANFQIITFNENAWTLRSFLSMRLMTWLEMVTFGSQARYLGCNDKFFYILE